jgi:Calcineurin-like phosphoesterase
VASRCRVVRLALATLLGALLLAAVPAATDARTTWPPVQGPGQLYVHFGEEHWNDDDGLTLLPKVVADSIRFRPLLVTMSGDKANDGNVEELTRWREIMRAYDRAGIPYFAGVGNHDRDAPPGAGGLPPPGSIEPYKDVFKGRRYPMGDAGARPSNDPAGASTHYFVDHGNVRWIFIDNSCWAIEECDPFQNPSAQNAARRPQLDWLRDVAGGASRTDRLVFVVMHMPTRDPGDQSYRDPTAFNHVMGKGVGTDDNDKLERVAEESGVDAVFVAHIKGQFIYRGRGNIPYFIDGGAGGELYTTGPVGVEHGFWHGFRLIRVSNGRFTTDSVPIFVPGGITIRGPARVARGRLARFEAFGKQPVFKDPAKVPALELRDPDPRPREGGTLGALTGGGWLLAPLAAFLLAGLVTLRDRLPRARPALVAGAVAALGLSALAAVSVAQRGTPTATPKSSLPNPARIWTTSNRFVLAPVPSSSEDPRRDPRTETHDGAFRARCAGRARVTIASGVEQRSQTVAVPSARGRIVRSVRLGLRSLRAGRKRRVARLRLTQPAEVLVRVRKGGRTLRTLRHGCFRAGRLSFFWDGRLRRRGKLLRARRGRYRIHLTVRSDRRPLRRSRLLRVRAR